MYDENSMKSHIFWIKFKRIFLLLVLTTIGTALGVVVSDYVVNILLFPEVLRIIIVVVSAVLFLSIALLLTANTGKEIADGYWKIAVYKKLAVISKKLDNLEPHDSNKQTSKSEAKNSDDSSINKNDTTKIDDTVATETILDNSSTEISPTTEENSSNAEIIEDLKEVVNTIAENEAPEINKEKLNSEK